MSHIQLVIKGALYFLDNELLIPHFTGEYSIVDCTAYVPWSFLEDNYGQHYLDENRENYITHNGKKYYYRETVQRCTGDMLLLSDLSDLQLFETNHE